MRSLMAALYTGENETIVFFLANEYMIEPLSSFDLIVRSVPPFFCDYVFKIQSFFVKSTLNLPI